MAHKPDTAIEHPPLGQGPGLVPAPELDVERFRPYLAELELSEDQERQFLEALWSIMLTFVELGFGVDSVQQLFPALDDFSLPDSEDRLDRMEQPETCAGDLKECFEDASREGKDGYP